MSNRECEKSYLAVASSIDEVGCSQLQSLPEALSENQPSEPDHSIGTTHIDWDVECHIVQNQSHSWKAVKPLNQKVSKLDNPYPVEGLPSVLKDAVCAISQLTQVPLDVAGQCILGSASFIAQALYDAPSRQGSMPCSVFMLTEGSSGSRKSRAQRLADHSTQQWERKRLEKYMQQFTEWQTCQRGLKGKELLELLAENSEPPDPTSQFSDSTFEAVAMRFITGSVRNASLSTDEAAQFFGGHTLRSETATANLGSLTKLFDDGAIKRTRSKSNVNGSGSAFDVRLTVNLLGQEAVLEKVISNPLYRGQGFLPRFLFAAPPSLIGQRLQNKEQFSQKPEQNSCLQAYWQRCHELLEKHDSVTERIAIKLSDEAQDVFLSFYNETEVAQAEDGKYQYISAFASRGEEIARRVATIFAAFEGKEEIDQQAAIGACQLVYYSLNQWLHYMGDERGTESDAELLLKWLLRFAESLKVQEFIYSYVQSKCNPKSLKDKHVFKLALQQLEDTNYIQVLKCGKVQYISINPSLLTTQ